MPAKEIRQPLVDYDRLRLSRFAQLVGVDEAGRGALAGPVSAGAVWIEGQFLKSDWVKKWGAVVNDSKQLKETQRSEVYQAMLEVRGTLGFDFATATASVAEIKRHNILQATCFAMVRAIEILAHRGHPVPERNPMPLWTGGEESQCRILVDGRPMARLGYEHEAIIKGDGKSFAIALASIAAKVSRDELMIKLDNKYPNYQYKKHKGYGTEVHRGAILSYGETVEHRGWWGREG